MIFQVQVDEVLAAAPAVIRKPIVKGAVAVEADALIPSGIPGCFSVFLNIGKGEEFSYRVIEHAVKLPRPDVIRPGNGQIHPFDDIFPLFVVKITVPHTPPPFSLIISIVDNRKIGNVENCLFLPFLVPNKNTGG